MKSIYLDHAASTAVDGRVIEAMQPYWSEFYGNASSIHQPGRQAAKGLDRARRTVSEILGCAPHEVIFTSCGSESDNLALRGVAIAQRERGRGNHLVTTAVEHHAVLTTAEQLRDHFGFELTVVPVDASGQVRVEDIAAALRPDTVLVSVMYANNEVGTVQPLAEISRLVRVRRIPFHTDAVQAGGQMPLKIDDLGVDLLSLSAHKFYGPKGVGVLYVRSETPLLPMQTGGGHERSRRAGTENVPYIVGLAEALRLAHSERETENARIAALRDRLRERLLAAVPGLTLTGHSEQRLPNSLTFLVDGLEAQGILMGLDMAGIAASSGSACTSGAQAPSHVLTAMGIDAQVAVGHIRLTLGRENIEQDVDRVLEVLPQLIERLRALTPAVV